MPIYEYLCKNCKHQFEEIVRVNAPSPSCPKCKNKAEKLISRPCLHFGGNDSPSEASTPSPRSGCSGCPGGSCKTCH